MITRGAGLVSVALLGGLIALGGVALTGDLGGGTTTVVRTSPSPAVAAPVAANNGLSVREIYSRAAPGVVQITSTTGAADTPNAAPSGSSAQPQQALGSGFVIDKAGHIITNYHVVQGARAVQVSFSNNESLKAKVVGSDPATDTAVLQVDAHATALHPLVFGNSDTVRVGDQVVAIGNPFGLERSATAGIVSAVGRSIQAPNQVASIDHAIQTDAAINHGNSGGPLLDAKGEVIGVNAQIETGGTGDGNVGIGFAIPINTVRDVASQLIRDGKVQHSFLGIEARPVTSDIAQLFHFPSTHGLLVTRVIKGTGAARAGVRAGTQTVVVEGDSWLLGGDLIVSADGHELNDVSRLRELIAAKKPGSSIALDLFRGTKKIHVKVKLGRQPTS
jgi:S1-C subfamily serine protease